MIRQKRVPAMLATAVIAVCGVSAPAMASTSKKWTKSQCTSYVKSWEKKHPKATKSQKTSADKTLKGDGCTETVK